jgi:tetratricopeptide (TPR) repeat protein
VSSYTKKIIVILFCIFLSSSLFANEQKRFNETTLMMMALDFENKGEKLKSRDTFMLLLSQTQKYEYLKYALSLSLQVKDYDTVLTLSAKYKHLFKEHYQDIARVEIMSLIKINQLDLALRFSKELLEKHKNATNYENVAVILYSQKMYKESLPYFESAYDENKNAKTLLNLVNVLYGYLDKKSLAISYLETYLGLNGCDLNVCQRLLGYYQEEQNIDGMASILKKIYKKHKQMNKNEESLDRITNAIIEVLKIKDINNAIKFLEENNIKDTRLLSLYHQTQEFKKALALTRKLYKETKDKNFLAQLAILQYESADNKEKILDTVVANFNIALKTIDKHQYQNYFGYLLIDHDINYKQGIELVEKALKQDSKNIAYRDSLAWGYYKTGQCQKAKKIMEELKSEVGLDDEELKKHYLEIKGCK